MNEWKRMNSMNHGTNLFTQIEIIFLCTVVVRASKNETLSNMSRPKKKKKKRLGLEKRLE